MKLEVVHALSPEIQKSWDALTPEHEIYHKHRFLRVLENSNVENASMRFGLLRDDSDTLVGCCVWSCFEVQLNLMVDEAWLAAILKTVPRMTSVRMLVLGTPISLGQSNLILPADQEQHDTAIKLLHQTTDALAQEFGVHILCGKEFRDDKLESPFFEQAGYIKTPSLPYFQMPIIWDDFKSYTNQMRHPYRRLMRQGLRKLSKEAQAWFNAPKFGIHGELQLCTLNNIDVRELHKLYLCVISRAKVVLETLPLSFFEELQREFGHELHCIGFSSNNAWVSLALVWPSKDTLHWMLVGRKEHTDSLKTYRNTVTAIIAWAIHLGKSHVDLGQTSAHAKCQAGAFPQDVRLWIRSRKQHIHLLLKFLTPILFPEIHTKPYHVFQPASSTTL
jgi:predicted N-acyltransferase